MKRILFLAVMALAMASCVSGPVSVEKVAPSKSVLLGERMVNFKADHDVIGVGGYSGTFRSLSFVVEKNDIEMFNLVIVYGNGEKEKIGTRLIFREGSRSRILDLHGGKRVIKSIQFTYRTVGNWAEGRARVAVYGIR
jgi:hypothetical protein